MHLRDLIGKKVTAIGNCGMGKGKEIEGILDTDGMNGYVVHVKQKNGFEMPYSVYTQSIKKHTDEQF